MQLEDITQECTWVCPLGKSQCELWLEEDNSTLFVLGFKDSALL